MNQRLAGPEVSSFSPHFPLHRLAWSLRRLLVRARALTSNGPISAAAGRFRFLFGVFFCVWEKCFWQKVQTYVWAERADAVTYDLQR